MKIEKVEVKPFGLSFEPEFHITIEYLVKETSKLPIRFNGYLFLDRFRFAFLHEYEFNHGRIDLLTSTSSTRNSEKRDKRFFVAPITRQALSKLEEKRNIDPKGDLKFNLHINFIFLEPTFDEVTQNIQQGQISLPTTSNNSLFRITNSELNEEIKISSSDWLHDFSSVFQRGKFQVFELPIPNGLTDSSELSKRLNAAIVSLQEMEDARNEGDWSKVVKESRPVWELIRNKDEIKESLRNDDIHEVTIVSFGRLIDSLFDFSSKFVHRESQNNEVMTNKASKEDADLIYAISVSLLNLITKKVTR